MRVPLLDEERVVRQDSEDEAEQALVQAQAQVRPICYHH